MNPLRQQIKTILHEQVNRDEKMVSKIHLLPDISIKDIIEFFGVSENKAFELLNAFARRIEEGHVTHIKGNLDLSNTLTTSLGNLQTVGGNLYLYRAKITSLGKLQTEGKHLELGDSSIATLSHLKYVGGYVNLHGSSVTYLGNLQTVGQWLDLRDTPITSLGKLKSVRTNLYLPENRIPQLELDKVQVGGDIYYR